MSNLVPAVLVLSSLVPVVLVWSNLVPAVLVLSNLVPGVLVLSVLLLVTVDSPGGEKPGCPSSPLTSHQLREKGRFHHLILILLIHS